MTRRGTERNRPRPATPSRSRVQAECRRLGVRLDDNGETLTVDAPAGRLWAGPRVHMLTADYEHGRKPDAYAAILDDMAAGLDDCDAPDCDYCAGL